MLGARFRFGRVNRVTGLRHRIRYRRRGYEDVELKVPRGEDGESERRLSDSAAESGRHGAREIPHRHQNEAGRRDDPRDGVPAERR